MWYPPSNVEENIDLFKFGEVGADGSRIGDIELSRLNPFWKRFQEFFVDVT